MSQALAQKAPRASILQKFAGRYSVDPGKMLETLKSTAFKVNYGAPVTDEQMIALLIVADQYKLNPFTKEIYAFPDKQNGIVPVVGVDGWSRIINENPAFDGMDFEYDEEIVTLDDAKPCPAACTCIIYRKDRSHPIKVTEYLDEVYRAPFEKNGKKFKGAWQSHTKRMLRHKAMIQAVRMAFGFVGIYDEDEAERIVAGQAIDITPTEQPQGESKVEKLKSRLGVNKDAEPEPDQEEEAITVDGELAKFDEELTHNQEAG